MYKEVNYKYLYNNTLKYIFFRRYNFSNSFHLKLVNSKFFFWYKRLPSDELNLLRLYDNLAVIWLLFDKKCKLETINSIYRRGVNYYSIIFSTLFNSNNNEIYKSLDILINGIIPVMRKTTMHSSIIHNNYILELTDLSFFSNIRMHQYYYVENIVDKFYLKFHSNNNIKINYYLNIFKLVN
jgi:hypothetical protein